MQLPSTHHRADDIIATLHNDSRNVANLSDVFDEVVVRLEEGIVHEVVAFYARKCHRKLRLCKLLYHCVIEEELRCASLPDAPGARSLKPHLLVIARQTAIVGAYHIIALFFWNDFQILFPHVREDVACALLIKPANLFRATKKDAAQDELPHSAGMRLRVSKRERAAPGAAEDLPSFYAQMLAQFFDV